MDTVRTMYEQFARQDVAAVLAKLDASVEWVEGGRGDSFVGPEADSTPSGPTTDVIVVGPRVPEMDAER